MSPGPPGCLRRGTGVSWVIRCFLWRALFWKHIRSSGKSLKVQQVFKTWFLNLLEAWTYTIFQGLIVGRKAVHLYKDPSTSPFRVSQSSAFSKVSVKWEGKCTKSTNPSWPSSIPGPDENQFYLPSFPVHNVLQNITDIT